MELFPKHNDIGAQFGNIIVSHRGSAFEVTTFREDDEASDGRYPERVVFGTRERDAHRRDFTVNALYWHPISRELYDPFEGEKDLEQLLVRLIGDPDTRIRHDALRLLRGVRLRARLGGQYHPDTYRVVHGLSVLAGDLSGSRVAGEIEKMLLGPNPARALEDLWETDILQYVIPELHACKGVAQPPQYHLEGDVWEHTLKCAAAFTEDHGIDTRFAAVFHDVGKATTFSLDERIRFDGHAKASGEIIRSVFTRLQWPKARREKIAWLAEHHMMMGSFEDMPTERKSHWYFHPWFRELLQIMWLDIAGTDPTDFHLYESIVNDYNTFLNAHPRPEKPLLSGSQVMELLGITPGERVGEVLSLLEEAQLRKEVQTKKEAAAFVESMRKEEN